MRLTGGTFRGHPLTSPRGGGIRPTSDRVREALFSILGDLDGVTVLDIFAGAGTLGLEALSRGAASVTFVDASIASIRAIEESLKRLGVGAVAETVKADARHALTRLEQRGASYELVFLDPPYGSPVLPVVLQGLATSRVLLPGALVMVEHDRDDLLPPQLGPLRLEDVRHYGRTVLSFFRNGQVTDD